MILCIDVGNTNIKYAVFDGDHLLLQEYVEGETKF